MRHKFNIKNKFFLKQEGKILQNQDIIISDKKYKNNILIDLIPIKNRNRARIKDSNNKVLKTVAMFFRYFLKVDFQYFDSILNTIKYSNQNLYSFILSKKISFINLIFSNKNEKCFSRISKEPNVKNFFDSFNKIFFDKSKTFNLKNYMEKKISSETSRNISSLYYDENNSKSSKVSKNSNNYNSNSTSNFYGEYLSMQRCLDFNVVENNYQFYESDFERKINNFILI